jgi:hypothetical protein
MGGVPETEATAAWEVGPIAKRRSFRLRKWYFDFLTPGLDYCFVYFADVHLPGATFRSLTLHLARPGRGAPATRTLAVEQATELVGGERDCTFSFAGGQIKIHGGGCSIDASGPGCSVHLQYMPLNRHLFRPVVICNGGRSRILWTPVQLKSSVSGSVDIGGEVIEVKGCDGYVDYLESSYLPPAVPVRTLYWGRLHHPELDLVFMRAADGSGNAAWSRLSVHADDTLIECEEVAIANRPGPHGFTSQTVSPTGYDADAACGSRRVHVKVRHAVAVQESSFIDHQQVRSSAARYILKKLTRDPRSTKWLSYADVMLEDGGTMKQICDVPLIDEFALL